ncbi:MAG: adenosylmethionine--8-amino-7-oxononanoate transaminase [Candidatus Brocadiia bacterium]
MKDLTRRCKDADLKHVWHPFTQHRYWDEAEIIVIERGDGPYLIDTEGRKYLDGVSSLWVNAHGHRNPEIDDAVRGQLASIAHSTFLGLSNVPASLLAEELCAIAPSGLSRVFFSDSGAEAVEIALKMAFQYCRQNGRSSRKSFLALGDAYHGDTIGAVSLGGIATFHAIFEPLLFQVVRVPAPFCYHCPYGMTGIESCGRECFAALEKAFAESGDELAAAVIEPRIQGAAGMIVHPPGYLRLMADLCKKCGVLLIADEVATGFGRTGGLFSCEGEGVSPDLMCLGKGITGGYLPLSATLTSEEVYQGFLGDIDEARAFYHGHSYTGNQLSAAAARANLAIFRRPETMAGIRTATKVLAEGLKRFEELDIVGNVRQLGLMAGIELVTDRSSRIAFDPSHRIGHKVVLSAREKGAILRPLGDVIVLMPPLCVEKPFLDSLIAIAYNSVREVSRELNV